jgi:hypothetical protein
MTAKYGEQVRVQRQSNQHSHSYPPFTTICIELFHVWNLGLIIDPYMVFHGILMHSAVVVRLICERYGFMVLIR